MVAHAQPEEGSSAAARTLSIVPTLTVQETLTNNVRLSASDRRSDLITRVSPGVRLTSTGGRLRGFLNYDLGAVHYARNSAPRELQNSLNTALHVEAIENWAYLDVMAAVGQASISAFGTQSSDPGLVNANRTEVRTWHLSPYVRGQLGDIAEYEGRVAQTTTSSSAGNASDATTRAASLRVGSPTAGVPVGWSADVLRQTYAFDAGRSTQSDQFRGTLWLTPDPQLRLSLIAGREANDFLSEEKTSHAIRGIGLNWTPSLRTQLALSAEERFFGRSHAVSFQFRSPRTAWRYSDVRDVSTGFGRPTLGTMGSVFDLYFSLFASQQPDPVLRTQLVNEFLATNGLDPNSTVFVRSNTASVTLQRQQELSFALQGLRDTVTFTAGQGTGRRLDAVATVSDDFSNGNDVRQRGFGLSWAHRLTPLSACNLLLASSKASGQGTGRSSSLRTAALSWATRTGPRTHLMVAVRHSTFDNGTTPYSESAVTASLSLQF